MYILAIITLGAIGEPATITPISDRIYEEYACDLAMINAPEATCVPVDYLEGRDHGG